MTFLAKIKTKKKKYIIYLSEEKKDIYKIILVEICNTY